MKINHLLILFYLGSLISCKQDKFNRDIAPALLNSPSAKRQSTYKVILMLTDSLKLGRIENGYDSLQIRIWVQSPFTRARVAIFKKDVNGWQSSLIIYMPENDNVNRDSVVFFTKETIAPRYQIRWPEFIDSLDNCNIMNLRDQSELKGYNHPNDGDTYIVEVSDKTKYRLYTYHEPEDNVKFKDAKRMAEIVRLVKRNTGYDLDGIPPYFKFK